MQNDFLRTFVSRNTHNSTINKNTGATDTRRSDVLLCTSGILRNSVRYYCLCCTRSTLLLYLLYLVREPTSRRSTSVPGTPQQKK